MIGELGHLLLILAVVAALVQAWAGLGAQAQPRLVTLAALWQIAGVLGAIVLLGVAFVNYDFSISYVAQNSHTTLPLIYRIAAVWGGHEGSMLLWLAALSLWSLATLYSLRQRDATYAARTLGVLGLVSLFIGAFVLFTSNPFTRTIDPNTLRLFTPPEGLSLNPLLQDPGMAAHPPMLYLGYVGTAVPFAMTLAALWRGAPAQWVRWVRPYTAVALLFLSIGIAIGSWWAYYELGWGGWWFWDPVENASLMPWLALAALLHVQIGRDLHGHFVYWTATLAIGAFILSLLGTFLVRSGVLISVHAFASDPRRGIMMLALIALALLGSLALVGWHGKHLLPARPAKAAALLSRETALALNNLLLVVSCGCVLLGTLYPLLTDALQLGKFSVGAPYFDTVMRPILMPALLLLMVSIWLRWGRDQGSALVRRLIPTLVALVIGVVALPLWLSRLYGAVHPFVLVTLLGALGVAVSTLHWAVQRLRSGGLGALGASGWGMVIAHAGVAVFAVGVAMVKGYGIERDVRMAHGDTVSLAGCALTFDGMTQNQGPNYVAQAGRFTLRCGTQAPLALVSEKRAYVGSGMPLTQSAIDWNMMRDIYVALSAPVDDASRVWSVRVQYKPFMRWVWLGVLMMAAGAFSSALARRLRRAAVAHAQPHTQPQGMPAAAMAPSGSPAPALALGSSE
ncbi:MAG: heme lyase CcmF/NrfE family subunit [Burkholderiaceae bacterium]|jgi:cytochrome c-type biogenesis protein CcmF|nr:heme lyase CcmF/NrfE family subunit [Burkholderiaceae bacterium]